MRGTESVMTAGVDDTVERTAVEQFWQYALGRRRTFLVDRKYQLRVMLLGSLFVVALLVPLNVTVYYSLVADPSSTQAAPELGAYLRAQDWRQFAYLVLASAVFIVGHFTIGLIETHRTAGAAFAIRRQMAKITSGRYGADLALRQDDNLLELAMEFNQMSHGLRDRAMSQAEALELLADDVEKLGGAGSAGEVASRLRVLASQTRATVG